MWTLLMILVISCSCLCLSGWDYWLEQFLITLCLQISMPKDYGKYCFIFISLASHMVLQQTLDLLSNALL